MVFGCFRVRGWNSETSVKQTASYIGTVAKLSTTSQSLTNQTLRRLTGPQQRPVSLSQAKQTCRLSQSDTTHDADLTDAIDAATEQVEQDTDRCCINQTFAMDMNVFPAGPIVFGQKPIDSITSIEYLDTDGETQLVDPETYALDQGRRQAYLVGGSSWPSAFAQQNAITVTYVCGYGETSSEVPRLIQRAILLQVGKWFYDPAMEGSNNTNWDSAYDRIITRILRTSYP